MPRTRRPRLILIDQSTLRTAAAGMVVESVDAARHAHRHAETVTPAVPAEAKGQSSGRAVHRAARKRQSYGCFLEMK
jgi:hypothetical protein